MVMSARRFGGATLIDIEGIDGAGKSTQAELLARWMEERGWRVEVIHFPAYETPSGQRIAAYLRGEAELGPREVQELFAQNRREKLADLERIRLAHHAVILDRYSPSGWAYGMARGFPLPWLLSLDAYLPMPDAVVVLDVPVEVAARRLGHRRLDDYERDKAFLAKVREAYLFLSRKYGWPVIADERPPEEVSAELRRAVSLQLPR